MLVSQMSQDSYEKLPDHQKRVVDETIRFLDFKLLECFPPTSGSQDGMIVLWDCDSSKHIAQEALAGWIVETRLQVRDQQTTEAINHCFDDEESNRLQARLQVLETEMSEIAKRLAEADEEGVRKI